MSKREIRAKRLVAAVLLAISVQMWSAPPLWAAEASVQAETSAAGEAKETKETKNAKAADSETGGEADADEGENVVVPVIGYSTRSAAGSDYGVIPLADMAVDGALTGVTGINGSELVLDKVNNNFFIGTTEYGAFDKNSKNRAVIGLGIYVGSNDNISVFGTSAEGNGESASAFGYDARADDFASVFGSGANAASNGNAFGYNAEATEQYGSAFGSGAVAGHNYTIAVGYSAKAAETYSIAVGSEAIVEVAKGIAIGALAHIEGYGGYADSGNIAIGTEAHTKALYSMAIGDRAESTLKNSIAIGASSNTTAENQVSFGTGSVNTVNGNEVITWDKRRSLAGISDIDMAGALTGVNKIDMKNGALTGVSTINGNVLVAMNEDVTNKSLAIGTGAAFSSSYSSVTTIYKNAIAIGNGAFAGGNGSLAIGFDSKGRAASAGGVGSISLNAIASGDHNVVISGWADAYDSVVIGYGSGTDNSNSVAIGSGSYGGGDGTVLGYAAATDGHNSVAIGAKSYVESGNDNQVSFGHKVGGFNYADGSNFTDDLFRSLVNVADIDMHGNISLGGEWKENTTSGLYESNGKGELNGVTSINGVIFAKDSMNNQDGLFIGTLASGTSFYGDASVMIGLDIDNSAIDAVGIGNGVKVSGDGSVAIGYGAEAMSNMAMYPTAIGFFARAIGDEVVAIGGSSYAVHEFSVALGDDSSTSAENQVSFGHKAGDKYGDGGRDTYGSDLFRSLVNVADIDMHGNISLGGEWKENTTSGLYESNGKGELNGVTSINGVIFVKDSMNNQEGLLIGTLAPDTYYAGGFSVMIGTNIDNQAIDAVGIGNDIKLTGDGSVAIGNSAEAISSGGYPTAIGFMAHAVGIDAVAIGANSNAEHEYSVALGDDSSTSAEKQVSFGNNDLFRSLVNVADIDMHGALTGVTGINGVTVSGTDASTGLTVGGNAVIGKTDTPFSSTGFAVAKDGAVTAKTVNGATITGTSFNGVTLSTDGKVNGAVITSNSFNGVKLEKGADSHYKVGGVDVTKMQTDVAGKADAATTLTGYGIADAYTKTETDTAIGKKADKATTLTGYGIADAYTKTETDTAIGKKADKATTLAGYGIADAYTKTETDTAIGKKADKATTLTGYGIADAYTKTETDTAIGKKADKATTLAGYGIADAYTKTETDTAIGKKADKATTLTGYGITDAYTKTAADAKITAATADMATKTQVTADIGTAKTALEIAYQAADNALSGRATALETKTAKFNTAGDNLTGMTNITSTAATLGGVGFASAGVMTGVASIDGIAIDASRNLSNAGTYNGVTVAAAGISGTSVFNGAAITNNSFNGVTLEKGADNHYKVGGVDVSALKTTVDSISADGVGTADTAGIKRDTTGTATTTIETNTKISSSGITTNKVTVSGATATTLENGKLTVGAATVQNTGFAVGSSSLNNGSLTVDGNNKLTTAGLTASKVTVGAVTVSGGKVSGLTDAALSAVSTEAVTGKQLNATNTTVSALDTAYQAADKQIRTDFAAADTALKTELNTAIDEKAKKATDLAGYGITDAYTKTAADEKITAATADMATKTQVTADIGTAKTALESAYKSADTQIRTDFAAADTTLQNNIDTKVAQTAYDTKMSALDSADTALGSRATALETVVNDSTTGLAAVNTKVGALDTAYKAADTALSGRAAALETAATGMSYDTGKNTTTFTGGVTATVLTAGEFKVGATGFGFGNDGALTAKTVNGIEIKKDESKVMVGGIDLTALSNGDVVTDNTKGIGRNQDTATTTIETNTAISSSGITTNAVTASGTVKASEFVEGSQKLSDKYAAKTALADYTTTTDMNTKFADYATTTAVDTKLADYAKSDSVYSKAAADTAFAKAGDVDTLKTTVGDTDGGLVKDVKDLQSGKADNATTLAGYGIADAYTQTEINEKIVEATKDLATSATVTDIQSGLDEVTGKTAGLSYDTASGSSKFSGSVVIGNEGAKTHTQITDDAIIFGEGTDKQVTVDASGIHVGKKAAGGIALYADADGTHIDHTSLVTGSVTADNLNGVAISGNATDGLSVGGVSIKALSERLDSLEQDGVATADMGGIKRTDVADGSGKTVIEGATGFTKDGLKTANLEAATAALGGVNFAAGAVTGVSSINGVVFGSDGKIGGVSLSGGKVDGVDVGWLDQRVKSLEDNGTGGGGTGGGGSSANTSGIHKPDRDTTNIEGNTSITTDGIDTNKVNASDAIVVADGEKNKTVISKDGILVAEGEKNQVKINEDGIHVGKNSSVVNDTDGFITDKGLYIGVSSSSDTSTAKFSVAPNGNLSSKAGDYGFSNTSADGAKFTHSGDTAYGTGSQLDTTIQGNKVTTGRIDTDELYVDGNKVTVAGGTINQTDAVDNHLSGTDGDGNTVTNDFKTSAVNGTTQAAEKTSADGKESTKTVNNTSAGGTGVTTSKTTTDSKDNVTVKESSFGTNEKGMTLSTSNKVTDKDGKVTKDTSGTTTMTGDSISVSKTTTTTEKDADGNEKEVTKTSGTTIGSGEVTLKREDGSTIEVGSAIEGMQSDMRELDGRVNRMGVEIKEVGALSAALAGLHPQPENANSRADFAMAMGSYEGKQALAVGGFYRPDKRTMLSIGASTTSSKHMMNMGISIALDRLPEAERRAKEAAKAAGVEQETLNRVLERLAALEQDNRRLQADNEKRDVAYEKLAADYTQLKEKYIEETADRQQPEQAEAEE